MKKARRPGTRVGLAAVATATCWVGVGDAVVDNGGFLRLLVAGGAGLRHLRRDAVRARVGALRYLGPSRLGPLRHIAARRNNNE